MLMERNPVVVGVVVAVLIAIGTVYAIGATGGAFVPGTRLTAEFTDAAGLSDGDFVFVAGVRVGQVLDVSIDGEVARAEFAMAAEEIPSDSQVAIIISNTLGKRALSITPGVASTVLEEGDVIPVSRTSTPIDLPELGDRSAELLGEVDVEALQELTTALADVTEGTRDDVVSLLEGDIVVERRDDLSRVLDRAQVVVDTLADEDERLVRIIDAFGSTLDRLAERRGDVTRLLRATASSTDTAATLLEDRDGQLDRVLASLHQDLEIIDSHQVDLAHVFAYLGVGLEGFASIGYTGGPAKADNPTWGNVFTTNIGAVGTGALLKCGGTLDELFTELVGPDPRCESEATAASESVIAPAGLTGQARLGTPAVVRTGVGGFLVPGVRR
jgi:phospholipid/cholesterol/gamma-HCH transport system substrate-binding protein